MATVLDSLNSALRRAMALDASVYLLGEDILDPYGGAFKVTRGLSTEFPGRVLPTPLSEAGLIGLASGMALRGLRPVAEIMFGDFATLIADQVINHAAKFRWMYNDQVRTPIIIRLPMGGRRGYGPTHSQTLEKLFLGVPGLKVLAPSAFGNPGDLLAGAILQGEDPTLFIENKLLYLLPVQSETDLADFEFSLVPPSPNSGRPYGGRAGADGTAPTYILSVRSAPPPVLTIASYGYMAEIARQAILKLAYEHEIFVEMVVPTQLAPFEIEPILASAQRTGRLLTVEEGGQTLGWGAEIVSRATEALGGGLKAARRLAAMDLPVPASGPLESMVLPGLDNLVELARKMIV